VRDKENVVGDGPTADVINDGQIIWIPPLPSKEEQHVCKPPAESSLILELEGTVWLCGCGKTWQVVMTKEGHVWKRERAVRRWWRHIRHGVHPTEPAAQYSTTRRLSGRQEPGRQLRC
jgi:hypothetical protein